MSVSEKPHLLLITRNMPPLVGGMETLMLHTAIALSDAYQVHVIAPKGCRKHLPNRITAHETSTSLPLFLIQSFLLAIYHTVTRRPVIAFGGSGLLAPSLALIKYLCRTRTACYVHGLDVIVDNKVYQRIFTPALRYLDIIVANSRNTADLAVKALVSPQKISVIHPGCDLSHPLSKVEARKQFDQKHHTEGQLLLLFVGRITPRKGLKAFLENGFAQLLARQPSCTLCVIGDSPSQSLNNYAPEKEELLAIISERNWQRHIQFLGKVDDQDLQQAYAAADCHLFPIIRQHGDVEGFGMVAIEAAAQGTPTVAFNVGGVADAVSDGRSGFLVDENDYPTLIDAIEKAAAISSENCRGFAENFSWNKYQASLTQLLVSCS